MSTPFDHDNLGFVPIGGGDIEMKNFILGRAAVGETGEEAACALVAEIEGHPRLEPGFAAIAEPRGGAGVVVGGSGRAAVNPQDRCRRFLSTNGGCAYVDLSHLELCLPEVTCATDYVAYWHAMLRIARDAQVRAERRLPEGEHIEVGVSNSDGRGHSYGAHLDLLIPRRTFDDLFSRRVQLMLELAAYQVSSIIWSGQGKVGSENGRPEVDYQISQRADFFETIAGTQTTYRRPLVNMRDEPLCGPWADGLADEWARLHVIFYDATLCHVSNWLRFGVAQLVLSMFASGRSNPSLILEDPLAAVVAWSHDPTLTRRMRTLAGRSLTAVELQMHFLDEVQAFVASGDCVVPEADALLETWRSTLDLLRVGAFESLTGRLDWVLKLATLHMAMDERRLDWAAPEIKHLDHLYGSLDPTRGLYWSFERDDVVERVVSRARIERAVAEPPADTRAWTRAMLLRRAEPFDIDHVDWDAIRFTLGDGWGRRPRTVSLSVPFDLGRERTAPVLETTMPFEGVLDALDEIIDDTTRPASGHAPPAKGDSNGHARDQAT